MNFGFTEEQELLRKTARDFLAASSPMTHVRDVMESPATYSKAVWKQMAELGWTGLSLPEAHGGAGLGLVESCIVVEELGRSLAPVPFLPSAIAVSALCELGDAAQQEVWLPRFASGEAIGTLAVTDAEARGAQIPADLASTARPAADGWILDGCKLFVPDAAAADVFLVVAPVGGEAGRGPGLFLVPRDAPGVELRAMASMDLLRPLSEVRFDGVSLPGDALLGGHVDAGSKLERVFDRARVMIAAEMLGGAEKCLEASVQYAKERVQFGKPIGVNQAIKHKCADMLFAVESGKSLAYYAAWASDALPEEAPISAAMAKAYASDAYRQVASENIQIHGGVGFTWEYDCHLFFKRAKSDEAWLGDATLHRERVARMLAL